MIYLEMDDNCIEIIIKNEFFFQDEMHLLVLFYNQIQIHH